MRPTLFRLIAGGGLGIAFSVSLLLPGVVVLPEEAPHRQLAAPDRPAATVVRAAPVRRRGTAAAAKRPVASPRPRAVVPRTRTRPVAQVATLAPKPPQPKAPPPHVTPMSVPRAVVPESEPEPDGRPSRPRREEDRKESSGREKPKKSKPKKGDEGRKKAKPPHEGKEKPRKEGKSGEDNRDRDDDDRGRAMITADAAGATTAPAARMPPWQRDGG